MLHKAFLKAHRSCNSRLTVELQILRHAWSYNKHLSMSMNDPLSLASAPPSTSHQHSLWAGPVPHSDKVKKSGCSQIHKHGCSSYLYILLVLSTCACVCAHACTVLCCYWCTAKVYSYNTQSICVSRVYAASYVSTGLLPATVLHNSLLFLNKTLQT